MFSSLSETMSLTIYHLSGFLSLRKEEPLPELFPQTPHTGPRWRIRLSLHPVLGLPCRLVHSRGVHSVTLLVHLLSLNRTMYPAHPCIPFLRTSMMSFTPLYTTLSWPQRPNQPDPASGPQRLNMPEIQVHYNIAHQ